MVTRAEVIQGILSLFDKPNYLEIGVSKGETFFAINAHHKVAVDPKFGFDAVKARLDLDNSHFYEVTSDEYFGSIANDGTKFDVIFVDGMHTAEQTLRDINNSIFHLNEGGVLIIDDTRPPSFLASISNLATFKKVKEFTRSSDNSWMGDVFRVVFFIDTFFQQLTYRTVIDNHGQTIAWRLRRPSVSTRTIEQVGRVTFEDMVKDINSLNRKMYADILQEIKDWKNSGDVDERVR